MRIRIFFCPFALVDYTIRLCWLVYALFFFVYAICMFRADGVAIVLDLPLEAENRTEMRLYFGNNEAFVKRTGFFCKYDRLILFFYVFFSPAAAYTFCV